LEQEVDHHDQLKILGMLPQCQLQLSEFTTFNPTKPKDGLKTIAKRKLEEYEDVENELLNPKK
jgi:hypothetical protein